MVICLDGNAFGYLGGPDSKIVRFAGGDPLAGVDRDATNLIYRPGNAAQCNAIKNVSGIPAIPVSVYGFQEPTGSTTIADLVGSKPLTISGSPSYEVAIAGAATKGIGGSGTAASQFAQATGVADVSTVETVLVGWCKIETPAATSQRMYQGGASQGAFEGLAGSNSIRYRCNTGAITGALDHTGGLFPIVLVQRAGFQIAYSNIEKAKIATPGSIAGTTFLVQFRTAGAGSIVVWNYAQRYEGAGAAWGGASPTEASIDQQVRDFLETHGWTVSGYGA